MHEAAACGETPAHIILVPGYGNEKGRIFRPVGLHEIHYTVSLLFGQDPLFGIRACRCVFYEEKNLQPEEVSLFMNGSPVNTWKLDLVRVRDVPKKR